jgi:cellulose synthase/poly-beta-1,6-N-acetylglucosamine synthase-like glycosyltransferase
MSFFYQLVLWGSLALVSYAYVGFPIAIYVCSRLFGHRPVPPQGENIDDLPSVSVLISALNEEDVIHERLENVLALDYPMEKLETVIASDGSFDKTAQIVQRYVEMYPGRIRLLDYSERRGKSTVLNTSLPQTKSEIVVLSDANTMFESKAVLNLARWFRNPAVGVVCGKLFLRDSQSGKNVDGLYWRYENFLKECESRLGALLGANGAIYAIRRNQYVPIPAETIIDDFVIPLLSKLRYRNQIIYDTEAIATEETAADIGGEFRRRCRIGAGGFQSLPRLWRLILPTHGWMSFAFISHKVFRWLCPAFLALALVCNFLLLDRPGYLWLLVAQIGFYLVAYLGNWLPGNGAMPRTLRLATMFTSMNLALAVGFWRWITGKQRGTWQRTAR